MAPVPVRTLDPAPPARGRLGRFELRATIGRSPQSVVYRAFDPTLGQEIALKTLLAGDGHDADAMLKAALAATALRHPHLVAVFEAGREDDVPCIVCELIEGQTLHATLVDRGSIAAPDALRWALGILDALDCGHRAGLVHRGLNPANIFIANDDSVRVTDFGTSASTGRQGRTGRSAIGTASYLAPEQLAASEVSAATDVFAAGLVLYEMLCGAPAIDTGGSLDALYRMAHTPIPRPSARGVALAAELESAIMCALEMSPRKRFQSATDFRAALERCLAPKAERAPEPEPPEPETRDPPTLAFLLRRMQRNEDFPAIASNVTEIRRKTSSGAESTVGDIANVILKDYALSTKLLKLVNSSYYGQYGGRISTVSRAVVILGLKRVRTAALSLLLFEHLESKGNADLLKDSAARAFLSGAIGRQMADAGVLCDPEEAFVCAMLRGLGRYLTIYYLPEEYAEIARTVESTGVPEANACRQVLGLGYEEIGAGVAREWKLPAAVVESIAGGGGARDRPPRDGQSALRVVTAYASDICETIVETPPDDVAGALASLHERYARCSPVPARAMAGLLESAIAEAREFGEAAGPGFAASPAMRSAAGFHHGVPGRAPAGAVEPSSGVEAANDRRTLLMSGIQDITNALLENTPVNDVLVMVLETMFRGLGFSRVVFCIADRRRGRMVARFGLGKNIDEIVRRFYFDLDGHSDAFARACRDKVDLVFPSPACTRQDVPAWHREVTAARSFAILPVVVNHMTVGMIYCDLEHDRRSLSGDDLNYLNTLRNQAALAVKQRR